MEALLTASQNLAQCSKDFIQTISMDPTTVLRTDKETEAQKDQAETICKSSQEPAAQVFSTSGFKGR